MKSFIRWSATLGLVGGTVLGTSLAGNLTALALPEQAIMKVLQPVPVFTIADKQGAPLVASVPNAKDNKKTAAVAGVFISQQDAQAFINNLKSKNPNLASTVQVVPVSLGEIYKLNQQNQGKPDQLEFAFVPTRPQVEAALALQKQGGKPAGQFNGVPMFMARQGAQGGYLTLKRGNEQVIPIFFNKEELQNLVDRFKQQQPKQSSNITIDVVNLEGVIDTLKSSNDQQLSQVVLIPPKQSLDYVRALQPAAKPNK
jgi:nickel transport protein